jgi:hypothetical protein
MWGASQGLAANGIQLFIITSSRRFIEECMSPVRGERCGWGHCHLLIRRAEVYDLVSVGMAGSSGIDEQKFCRYHPTPLPLPADRTFSFLLVRFQQRTKSLFPQLFLLHLLIAASAALIIMRGGRSKIPTWDVCLFIYLLVMLLPRTATAQAPLGNKLLLLAKLSILKDSQIYRQMEFYNDKDPDSSSTASDTAMLTKMYSPGCQ